VLYIYGLKFYLKIFTEQKSLKRIKAI